MIYTSYFGNKKVINNPSIFPVSIALHPPKDFIGKSYRDLAPLPGTLRDWKRDHSIANYERDYYILLSNLNQKDVVDRLMVLSGNFNNLNYLPDIVLLCYERPGEFCHRHLVAEWLRNDGYEVEELSTQ